MKRLVKGELGMRVEIWHTAMQDEERARQLTRMQGELEWKAADASKGAGLRQLKQIMIRLAKGEKAMRVEIWRQSVKVAQHGTDEHTREIERLSNLDRMVLKMKAVSLRQMDRVMRHLQDHRAAAALQNWMWGVRRERGGSLSDADAEQALGDIARLQCECTELFAQQRAVLDEEKQRAETARQFRLASMGRQLCLQWRHLGVQRAQSLLLVWRMHMIAGHFDAILTSQLNQSVGEESVALERLRVELEVKERENRDLQEEQRSLFEYSDKMTAELHRKNKTAIAAAVLLLYINVTVDRLESRAKLGVQLWRMAMNWEVEEALSEEERLLERKRGYLRHIALAWRHIVTRGLQTMLERWRMSMIASHFDAMLTSQAERFTLSAEEELDRTKADNEEILQKMSRAARDEVHGVQLRYEGQAQGMHTELQERKAAAEELAQLVPALEGQMTARMRTWGLRLLRTRVVESGSRSHLRRVVSVWKRALGVALGDAHVKVCVALRELEEDYAKLEEVPISLPPCLPRVFASFVPNALSFLLQGYEEAERDNEVQILLEKEKQAQQEFPEQARRLRQAGLRVMHRAVRMWTTTAVRVALRRWEDGMKAETRGSLMARLHSTLMIEESDRARAERQCT